MSFDRSTVRQAATELAEEKLDADLTRLEIDQRNRTHWIAYQCGMACTVGEFDSKEAS